MGRLHIKHLLQSPCETDADLVVAAPGYRTATYCRDRLKQTALCQVAQQHLQT